MSNGAAPSVLLDVDSTVCTTTPVLGASPRQQVRCADELHRSVSDSAAATSSSALPLLTRANSAVANSATNELSPALDVAKL